MAYKPGHKHSDTIKQRISKSRLGIKPWNKGRHTKLGYLSPKDYQMLLEEQNGVCAICYKPETQISNKK